MVTLILSIIFWCKPQIKGLGIAAMILSAIGACADFYLVGWAGIIDIIFLIINFIVYKKNHIDAI